MNPTRGGSYVSPQPTGSGTAPVYLNTLALNHPAIEDTIVGKVTDANGAKWGKLKSGIGYISLNYTQRI